MYGEVDWGGEFNACVVLVAWIDEAFMKRKICHAELRGHGDMVLMLLTSTSLFICYYQLIEWAISLVKWILRLYLKTLSKSTLVKRKGLFQLRNTWCEPKMKWIKNKSTRRLQMNVWTPFLLNQAGNKASFGGWGLWDRLW